MIGGKTPYLEAARTSENQEKLKRVTKDMWKAICSGNWVGVVDAVESYRDGEVQLLEISSDEINSKLQSYSDNHEVAAKFSGAGKGGDFVAVAILRAN